SARPRWKKALVPRRLLGDVIGGLLLVALELLRLLAHAVELPLGLRRPRRVPHHGPGERELRREGHRGQAHQEDDQLSDAHGESLPDLRRVPPPFISSMLCAGGYMRLCTTLATIALAACGGSASLNPGE